MTAPKWLSIVGVGEAGLAELTAAARLLLEQAEVVCGGQRHLAMLPPSDTRDKLFWSSPIADSVQQVVQQRGRSTCVLASGDPLCYGIGTTLLRHVPIDEMTIIPAPSAFSLACARLGWSLPEVEQISLCGRDSAVLRAVLYPQARVLILSADRQTPREVAKLLTQAGYGQSTITVLERLGSPHERHIRGTAASWSAVEGSDLNTIAVECVADAGITGLSRLAGLPDTVYQHDGQLTKREVRAITLAALAPLPGQVLWDVGAGCGSIGIEWMRSHPRCHAIAIEPQPQRLRYIADNAVALGTPNLQIIAGTAPAALGTLPQPNAIFVGGGLTTPSLLDTCWQALPLGGRLVANAVTLESEQVLLQWHHARGGTLTRIAIQRTEPIGGFLGWKPLAPVTQWVGIVQG
ncbi:MAG: precorrin-6y C5,15-methyltransferase (decarboxylating) subunit CbiE [Synechococcales cyanobacterium M58_A2018_015]|nr:precorrin-6y C5,15-methyltransferase (decarboxylating) subunit CbiE [Synechococcales cyanobacterium M58_A2018_015]